MSRSKYVILHHILNHDDHHANHPKAIEMPRPTCDSSIQIAIDEWLLVVQLAARAQCCIILSQHKQQRNGECSSKGKRATGYARTSVLTVGQKGGSGHSVLEVEGAVGGKDVKDGADGQQPQKGQAESPDSVCLCRARLRQYRSTSRAAGIAKHAARLMRTVKVLPLRQDHGR